MRTMPFGKFRGYPLDEFEMSYLVWVLEKATSVSPILREEIEQELGKRFAPPPPPSSAGRGSCPDTALAADIIATGLRTLARKCHPDVGGDTNTMQALNATVEWLRKRMAQ